MDENELTRDKLRTLVTQIKTLVSKLPETRLNDLKGFYPTVDADLQAVEEELGKRDCIILVAGIVNDAITYSGLSSMSNREPHLRGIVEFNYS